MTFYGFACVHNMYYIVYIYHSQFSANVFRQRKRAPHRFVTFRVSLLFDPHMDKLQKQKGMFYSVLF